MNARPRSQDKLIDAALLLFAEKGFPAVNEENLLEFAKVSRGILVYHFGNKAGLLEEILRLHYPCVEKIIPSNSNAEEANPESLVNLIDSWVHSLTTHPTWWKCYFRLIQDQESRVILESDAFINKIFHQYRSELGAYFSLNKVKNVPIEVSLFESLRMGISIEYLNQPDTYPLESILQLWKEKFLPYPTA